MLKINRIINYKTNLVNQLTYNLNSKAKQLCQQDQVAV